MIHYLGLFSKEYHLLKKDRPIRKREARGDTPFYLSLIYTGDREGKKNTILYWKAAPSYKSRELQEPAHPYRERELEG